MARRGYSLVELLVALAILALLALGMLRYLGACLDAMRRTGGDLAAQRCLRRAMDRLSDDVQEAGFFLPCRGRAPPGPPFALRREAPEGPVELVCSRDRVHPGWVHLARPLLPEEPVPQSRWIRLQAEHPVSLEPGDLVVVEDGQWEGLRVESPVEVPAGKACEVRVAPLDAATPRAHASRTPLLLVLPWRSVAYRGPGLLRAEEGEAEEAIEGITGFEVELREGPLLELSLESGSRTLRLLRAPRNR